MVTCLVLSVPHDGKPERVRLPPRSSISIRAGSRPQPPARPSAIVGASRPRKASGKQSNAVRSRPRRGRGLRSIRRRLRRAAAGRRHFSRNHISARGKSISLAPQIFTSSASARSVPEPAAARAPGRQNQNRAKTGAENFGVGIHRARAADDHPQIVFGQPLFLRRRR